MLLMALGKASFWGCQFSTKQLLRTMKLTAFILLTACLTASAGGYSQKVTISEKNASIEKVFGIIEKQTGFVFFYDYSLIAQAKKVNIEVKDIPLPEVLPLCFKDQP